MEKEERKNEEVKKEGFFDKFVSFINKLGEMKERSEGRRAKNLEREIGILKNKASVEEARLHLDKVKTERQKIKSDRLASNPIFKNTNDRMFPDWGKNFGEEKDRRKIL